MKLIGRLADGDISINIERNGSMIQAEIDGRVYVLESSVPEPNVYLLKYNNNIFEVLITPARKEGASIAAKVKGEDFEIDLIDPKRMRGKALQMEGADGILELKTAMPGKVVKVLVEEGAEVLKGMGILVVEAMKMQNEMKTTKDGVVKEIRFSEGETVNAGDVLAVIE